MSRIGRMPVVIPKGVDVNIRKDNKVTVKGPKGLITKQMDSGMDIKVENGAIIVRRPSDEKNCKALHGLTRSLINNMVQGVTMGFEKVLEINGVGYRAKKEENKIVLNVGYSHPVEMEEPEGITIEIPNPNRIVVKGADKQAVGEFAARIRSKRKPEPYKGKGIRYENEVVRHKEGKTGSKVGA